MNGIYTLLYFVDADVLDRQVLKAMMQANIKKKMILIVKRYLKELHQNNKNALLFYLFEDKVVSYSSLK